MTRPAVQQQLRSIVESYEKNPARVEAHKILFGLLNSRQIEGEEAELLYSAASTLPAVTLQDFAYKLAIWKFGTRERAQLTSAEEVASSLLSDLCYVAGVSITAE